jgi:small subunit ribosomal protein S16
VICLWRIAGIDYKRLAKETIMAVKLRMMRMGRRNRPFFRINAIDSRSPRDGKIIEKVGHYDPIEKDKSKQVVLNTERIKYWLDKGAIPSDTVSQILLRSGIKHKYAEERAVRRGRAKAIARAKGQLFTKAERAAAEKAAAKAEEEAKTQAEAKAKAEKEAKAKAEAEAKVKAEAPEAAEKKVEVKTAAEPKAKVKKEAKAKEEIVKEAKAKTEAKQKAEEEQKPEKKKKPVRVKKTDKSDEN